MAPPFHPRDESRDPWGAMSVGSHRRASNCLSSGCALCVRGCCGCWKVGQEVAQEHKEPWVGQQGICARANPGYSGAPRLAQGAGTALYQKRKPALESPCPKHPGYLLWTGTCRRDTFRMLGGWLSHCLLNFMPLRTTGPTGSWCSKRQGPMCSNCTLRD